MAWSALCRRRAIGTARATARPITVSPGDPSKLDLVEARCPTFSWGSGAGASSYELVIYRLGDEEEEAQLVLQETFAGSASSWTPPMNRCLERGGQYGWSVRSVVENAASEWSPPGLFEVASGPSEAELEAAVDVLRRHLAAGGEKEVSSGEPVTAKAALRAAGSRRPLPVPSEMVLPPTLLNVAGNVSATSYTGDGSMLDGVHNADPPCWNTSHRFVDCGNGTVTDTLTRLIYLKNANCFGAQIWPTANQSAAQLADGACGLTDGSRAGDWRLPKREDWESIVSPGCAWDPEIVGNGSPATGCYSTTSNGSAENGWASGVVLAYWSSSPYVGSGVTTLASYVDMDTPGIFSASKTAALWVWPVRGGQ